MNKIIFIFSIGILLTNCSNNKTETVGNNRATEENQTATSEDFIKDISVKEFKTLAENGEGIILDVRTPEETSQGHLENASLINLFDENFTDKINLMQKDKEIYVYCKSGGRSAQAAEILQENGFSKIYNMKGGIMAWENANYPLTEATELLDDNINTVSLEDFNTLLASDTPVLIDFHTLWCVPCQKMAPIIDEIESEYQGKATVTRIDADASKELAKAYNVQGVPEFVLFVDGKQVWKHNGIIEKEKLIAELEAVL